jgi:hypothetical protein
MFYCSVTTALGLLQARFVSRRETGKRYLNCRACTIYGADQVHDITGQEDKSCVVCPYDSSRQRSFVASVMRSFV